MNEEERQTKRIRDIIARFAKLGKDACKAALQFDAANIPEEYWTFTPETYIRAGGDEKAAKRCADYCENLEKFRREGVGPLFWSEKYGTGKTCLASMVLKEAIKAGFSARFYAMSSLTDDILAGLKNESRARRVQEIIEDVDFLALDDFGKERRGWEGKLGDLVSNRLDSLLRKRQGHLRVTLGSTNMTMKDLEGGYGKSVFSIFRRSLFPIHVNSERDMRGGHAEKVWNKITGKKKTK